MKYSSTEEKWNIATHAFGVLMSIVATYFMIQQAEDSESLWASAVFGTSLIMLYTASTLYHAATHEEKRMKLRIFDHAAIFVLIAGTYTPICLISLWDTWGRHLLVATWGIAVVGILLKLFYTGKYDRASTILYVGMGWIAIIAIKPLLAAFDIEPLLWLLAGGISYTTGAIIYSFRKIPFNHAIFHVFVLGGSFCHFVMIYRFVI